MRKDSLLLIVVFVVIVVRFGSPSTVLRGQDLEAEHEGVARNVSGSCPTLTLSVGDALVAIDGVTEFEGGSCEDVRDGVRIEVEGELQPDGRVRAGEVEFESDDDDDDDDDDDVDVGRHLQVQRTETLAE